MELLDLLLRLMLVRITAVSCELARAAALPSDSLYTRDCKVLDVLYKACKYRIVEVVVVVALRILLYELCSLAESLHCSELR